MENRILDGLRIARSFLFVPGDRPERFPKAEASGTDVVVIDLEDSVGPQARPEARAHVADWLGSGHRAVVRISGSGSRAMQEDLKAVSRPGLIGIMIPKVESRGPLDHVASHLTDKVPLVVLIESARGVLAAADIAGHPHASRLALGSADFQLETGIAATPGALAPIRSMLTLASRAAGLPGPIDGPCLNFRKPDATLYEARTAARAGFRGKLCIHPVQVEPVNGAFQPSPREVSWAKRVLVARDRAGGRGATAVDGEMIDLPVINRAQQILAAVGTPSAHSAGQEMTP